MTADVRNLLRYLGATRLRYRDLHTATAPRRRHQKFTTLAVEGSAQLSANLAQALALRGLRVAAFGVPASVAQSRRVQVVEPGVLPSALACDVALIADGHEQSLSDADLALIAVRPQDDVTPIDAFLARCRPAWRRAPARYVVEQLDAGKAEDRAGLRSLRARLGARLLEPAVHFDPSPLFPAHSQAAADVAALVRTLFPAGRDA